MMPAFPDPRERRAIRRIVARAIATPQATRLDRRALQADLELIHANGCPLDRQRMLRVNDMDFFHDVLGIVRALDRATGILVGFTPRCAARRRRAYREAA